MVTISGPTETPCFVCSSKESMNVQFADKSFKGSLCAKCTYAKVKPEVKGVPNGQPAKSG